MSVLVLPAWAGRGGGGGGGSGGGGRAAGASPAPDSAVAPAPESCSSGESGTAATWTGRRITADVTWTLTFDEEALAAGRSDCTYTRSYDGAEIAGWDFLCADCDPLTRGVATMTDGLDCYRQISPDGTAERTELWGLATGTLFRATDDQRALAELATVQTDGGEASGAVEWSSEGALSEGTVTLSAAGVVSSSIDEDVVLSDPFAPRTTPYTCGWECADPGTHALDYTPEIGETFPNVRLMDTCGEWVDLWDFTGSFLVIDSAQPDCGPCRSMAEAAPAFLEDMRARGVAVRVITLLGGGLDEPWKTPGEETLLGWQDSWGDGEPLLADRGFSWAVFPPLITGFTGSDFGWPAWVVVDPQMRLLHGATGFSSWDEIAVLILASVPSGSRSVADEHGATPALERNLHFSDVRVGPGEQPQRDACTREDPGHHEAIGEQREGDGVEHGVAPSDDFNADLHPRY